MACTENYGIYSGIMRMSKKINTDICEGNLVDFAWKARLSHHLGYANCELVQNYNWQILQSQQNLYCWNAAQSLFKMAFTERVINEKMFYTLLNYLQRQNADIKQSVRNYFALEQMILAENGHEIFLHECGCCQKQMDLTYVSPKTGRAIARECGAQYANKLLPLPQFLFDNSTPISLLGLQQAFALTGYFMQRYIYPNKPAPQERYVLLEYWSKQIKSSLGS